MINNGDLYDEVYVGNNHSIQFIESYCDPQHDIAGKNHFAPTRKKGKACQHIEHSSIKTSFTKING
jgi:hypothetical protein